MLSLITGKGVRAKMLREEKEKEKKMKSLRTEQDLKQREKEEDMQNSRAKGSSYIVVDEYSRWWMCGWGMRVGITKSKRKCA